MTVARSQLVDVHVTPWYHLISKTVRGAYLLRDGDDNRKQWIEDRLRFLSQVFAIDVAGFAILDNHFHGLVRLDPERVDSWSDEDVVRRWGKLFSPRGKNRKPLKITKTWIEAMLADKKFVANCRERLSDIGWFMKCLKEPLARMVNREEEQTGAFWQSRYKSIAILDDEALLATCAYIDLNPVAAGMAKLPEESEHTSVKSRVDHCRDKGLLESLTATTQGDAQRLRENRKIERGHWLSPIEHQPNKADSRPGLLEGLTLGNYLEIVDYTSRLVRNGKARLSSEVSGILDRLGTSASLWSHNLQRMFGRKRLTGVAFSFHREKLDAVAKQRGCQHMANLNGCKA